MKKHEGATSSPRQQRARRVGASGFNGNSGSLTPMSSTLSSVGSRGTPRRPMSLYNDNDNDTDENRVYRPLLFNSKGYASSEMYRDTYEMRARLSPSTALLGAQHGPAGFARTRDGFLLPHGAHHGHGHGHEQHSHHTAAEAQIRLETLSSRAAMTVLWITYLSFVFAFVLPYVQSQGFLETVITLPGDECKTADRWTARDEMPCIHVDPSTNVARWSAFVSNVSVYAGTIDLRLVINDLKDPSAQRPTLVNTVDVALWKHHAAMPQRGHHQPNRSTRAIRVKALPVISMDVLEESFVLRYDLFLYGVNFETTPFTKEWIATEFNQSVWVDCPSRDGCKPTKLFEVRQDLGGSGYGSYLAIVFFKGMYPNAIGKLITYDFAYTKPAIHVSELVLRTGFLVATLLSLPCWFIAVYNYHESWREILPVQKWVLALGVVLILWQNPIYATIEWYRTVSPRTHFVSDSCESFAEAFFYVFWLKLMDYHGNFIELIPKIIFGMVFFGVDTSMTIIRMPKYAAGDKATVDTQNELFVVLGFVKIALQLVWLGWMVKLSWQTRKHLRTLPYMTTRFEQLSYRFLFLETLLVICYVSVFSGLQVFQLFETWYHLGFDSFIQASVHTFAMAQNGRPSLGKLIFLSVYVYLMMFVHLPPSAGDSTGLLATTAYHVDDRPRLDRYGFLAPDSHLFCVETSKLLMELAWQAYFDPPGSPSPFGDGELQLEKYGYELVAQLKSAKTDTYVIVAVSATTNRLVVAFRGTTSKQNWISNLKFHQEVLFITSKGKISGRTCVEKMKDFAAKIPILNIALPSVHSGFWTAYASVRTELKEVIRLVLDENPGASVYLTGHSMGGTLAILAAYDLAVNMSMKVNMYNFGGPRVGNPIFVRQYNRCVPTSYRVVMDGDIVPGVPDFWGMYQHVGTEIAIDQEGNLIVDPSLVEKKLHVSSKRKVASHPTHVYRAAIAKCLHNLKNDV